MYCDGHGKLWCSFLEVDHPEEPRQWNSFGIYDSDRKTQFIAVEINIPLRSNSRRFAGFFARDLQTGRTYLLHDGSIGGGTEGVSRANFLIWHGSRPVDVQVPGQKPREGVVIGDIGSSSFASRLSSYVNSVQSFKDGVKSGEISQKQIKQAAKDWSDYSDEASGRKRGKRRSELDYFSYHGDVVRGLRDARAKTLKKGERIGNNKLIDLFVSKGDRLCEVYEVKTSLDRQSLYTALGQVTTHSFAGPEIAKRFLVLPEGDLPDGFDRSFDEFGVEVRRFRISGGKNPQVNLF
jgi:hypothetical protein